MKNLGLLWLFAALSVCSPLTTRAQTPYAPPASPRATYNFNPGWKLFVGDPANAQTSAFNDAAWKAVTLPHAWNEDSAFKVAIHNLPTGIAWYRKRFVLPTDSAGKKVFLEFEGIRHGGAFYLNGQSLGLHENGVMAAGFDATPHILPYPQENVVAVRTDNSFSYVEVATGSTYQWNSTSFYANYGGINKDVKLHLTGKTYQTLPLYSNLGTTGTYVHAQAIEVAARTATLHADTQVRNEDSVARTLDYEVVVVDADGAMLTSFSGPSLTLAAGQTGVLSASAAAANLNFWSWGYGYLYDVYTIVKESGAMLDVVRTRTGFRKTQFTDGMVRLNDRALNLHGFAQRSTDEWPAIGNSVPTWLIDFSQRMVVDGGGNLMRWMHVTPAKQIVEACDRQGLPHALPAGDSEGDVTGRRWEQRKEVMRDAIIYNRNNPSVIFYEGGNDGISETHMIEMRAIRDQYDPHGGRAIGSREMMGSTTAEFGGEMLYLNKSATKPMWMTEYQRDEALRKYWDEFSPPYHANGDYVHQNSDSIARANVRAWNNAYVHRPGTGTRVSAGGVKIVFSDTNTHYRGNQNYRGSGVVDALRIPKDSWFAHRVMWDCWSDIENPRAHIIGHWNYAAGVTKDIHVVSSAEYVELFVNGASQGNGIKSSDFLFTWSQVAWSPGTLHAVGYDAQDNPICSDTRQTAGAATALRLTPIVNPTGWRADGHDLALYEVEVIDAAGHRCPVNFDLIHFTLDGPAQWRGGLAVRSDETAGDNYILSTSLPVECGVNRVLVRSTTVAGTVTLTASAAGLTSATATMNTVPFTVTNGLATWLPGAELPPNYSRGPTPSTPAYSATRVAVPATNITAGSGGSGAPTNTIDDNETTLWTSGATLGQNWIQYTLARTAALSQIVLKYDASPRDSVYPIAVQVNGQTIYSGTPPAGDGYVTLDLSATSGDTVRVSRTNSGSFPLLEIEFYEAVNPGSAPRAPAGLTATTTGGTQVNLAWIDTSDDETSFKIEHSIDGVNFAAFGTAARNAKTFAATGLAPATLHYFRVRAANSAGESAAVSASAATPAGPPAAPAGLTGAPGDTRMQLAWEASAGATSYLVQRSTTSGGPYSIITTTTSTTFTDTGLTNGIHYYYVIVAVGPSGQSAPSAQINTTPQPGPADVFWINTDTASAQSWNVNANWSNGTGFPNAAVTTAVVTAAISGNQTIHLNQPVTIRGLTLGAPSGAYTLAPNGGALTFDNTPDAASLQQVVGSLTNTLSAPVANHSDVIVTNSSANPLVFSGVISGATTLTLQGDVTLSAANTLSGSTVLQSGNLRLASALALQGSTLDYAGGNLFFAGLTAATLGGLAGTQDLTLANTAGAAVALTVGANNAGTDYAGALKGPGSLTKSGSGELQLSGAHTFTGNIVIQGGKLSVTAGVFGTPTSSIQVGNGTTGASFNVTGGSVTVQTLNVAPVANSTGCSASITGSASAAFAAVNIGSSTNTSGPLIIDTTGSVSLGAFIGAKDLQGTGPSVGNGLIIKSSAVTATSVAIQNATSGANLNILGGSLTIGNASSTGAFKVGNANSTRGGFLTMTGGSLTYFGADGLLLTTVSGSTSGFSLTGATSAATLTGVTLNHVNAASATSKLVVSGGATLYLGGVGLVIKQPGANVSATLGAATIGASADWASTAPITLTEITTFRAADAAGAARNISLGGVLSGVGGLAKTDSGRLTLTGASTYTGATSVSAGQLLITGSLGTGPVSVSSGATLGGTGTLGGGLTLASGANLALGVAPSAIRGLTVGGTTTLNGAITVIPALLGGTLAPGTYTVLTYAGTLGGSPSFTWYDPAGSHYAATFSTATAGQIRVTLAPPTALQSWRQTHFGTMVASGAAADSADPDGDGLSNFLEYAVGTSPTAATASAYQSRLSDGFLQLTFDRVADPAITYTVQGTNDLLNWSDLWTSTGPANIAGPVVVTDSVPADPRRFLRLRASY